MPTWSQLNGAKLALEILRAESNVHRSQGKKLAISDILFFAKRKGESFIYVHGFNSQFATVNRSIYISRLAQILSCARESLF